MTASVVSCESIVARLRDDVPGFADVYDEHVKDNDEVLPHVLFGDLVRFLAAQVRERGATAAALTIVMPLLEEGMASPDERLQNLVSVSFLENLLGEDELVKASEPLMGPHLREEFERYKAL